MGGLCFITVLGACLSLAGYAHAYGTGAPDSACMSMMPNHGVAPQSSPSPYKVTPSKTTIGPGEQIEVTVAGDGRFKGFFIRARQNGNFIGEFQANSLGKLRCARQGITHTSPSIKDMVKVTWTAPADLGSGPVQFVATVVEERLKFWTMVTSQDISVGGSGGTNMSTGSVTNMSTGGVTNMSTGGVTNMSTGGVTTSTADSNGNSGGQSGNMNGNGDDDDDDDDAGNEANVVQNPGVVMVDPDCGKTKGCYHDCRGAGRCSYFISWLYEQDTVHFQFLYRTTSSTDQWIALGLSNDEFMGDDSVMECVMDQGKVLVKTSYNTGKFNEYPDDKHAGLSAYGGSVKNGVLACSFQRKIAYPRESRVFDLNRAYYLMVASGEAVSGNKFPHSYERLPKVSSEKISVKQIGSVKHGLDPLYTMVKTHGTAMTLGWMFFASCGVFIARHGKTMFNNSKPFGLLVWFHIHRFCMGMTAFLTVAGFILILVESKGYSHIPDTPGKVYRILHPPLGLILVVLTVVNPMMAMFRPDHTSPSRPLFNWTHWGCGMIAWLVSFALLLIGLDLRKSQSDVEAIYVVLAFIGYHIVIDIVTRAAPFTIGGIWGWFVNGCCRNKNSYDLNMTEFTPTNEVPAMTVNGIASNKDAADREHERALRRENIVRSVLLVFHMIASACFAVAVLYFFLRRPIGYLPEPTSYDDATLRSEDGDAVTVVG